MFPPTLSTPVLRSRLVRGLDLAVEFATLGAYGVEEVEVEVEGTQAGPRGLDFAWDWPQRCGEARARSLQPTSPRARRPL